MSTLIYLHRYDHRPTTAERLAHRLGSALIRWAERTAAARDARSADRAVERRARVMRLYQAEQRRDQAVLMLGQGPRQF